MLCSALLVGDSYINSGIFKNVSSLISKCFLWFFVFIFSVELKAEINQQEALEQALSKVEQEGLSEYQVNVDSAVSAANNASTVELQGMSSEKLKQDLKIYQKHMPDIIEQTAGAARRMSDNGPVSRYGISDQSVAELRQAALDAFAIDTGVQGFIFVSRSMPDSLIRSYAIAATDYGMMLIFRGPNKGELDLFKSLVDWGNLFHTTGHTMAVQMDPRLFDAYEIKTVPTIVLTKTASLDICSNMTTEIFTYQGEDIPVKRCAKQPEDTYCKLSGSVTVPWAVDHMAQGGCQYAKEFLSIMVNDDKDKLAKTTSENDWNNYVLNVKNTLEESIHVEATMKAVTEEFFE